MASMFGVGSLGPGWMPQGLRGAGPLSGSSRRGGHWGRLSSGGGGSPGPARSPTLRLGKCARAAAAAGPGGGPASCFAASWGQIPDVTHWQGRAEHCLDRRARAPGPGSPATRRHSRRPRVRCPGVWRGRKPPQMAAQPLCLPARKPATARS